MSPQKKYFGTDGIRGQIGSSLINPEFVLKLGWAVGKVLAASSHERGKVLIGKDTRISGYLLESALEAGLCAAGVDIFLLGPMPTPGIAYLTRTLGAKVGIVISASHNPYHDNGIKFFSSYGRKLPDEVELAIEAQLDLPLETVQSESLGKAVRVIDAPGRYIEVCKNTVSSNISFRGMTVVVDCANGATYHIAPHVFRELGANVIEMNNEPNGFNINAQCGSTNTSQLQKRVLSEHADLGIALDGDGDRLIMVDHKGEVVDGDEILYIITKHKLAKKSLSGGVVGTVMSNLGLEIAIKKLGVEFVRSKVGDRHVMSELLKHNWYLGGESSGHIICLSDATTGDGIIAALQVLSAICTSGATLYEHKSGMKKYPQTMINVKASNGKEIVNSPEIISAILSHEKALGESGRVLLRPSGTEPVIRVMVEGENRDEVATRANQLAQLVKSNVDCIT